MRYFCMLSASAFMSFEHDDMNSTEFTYTPVIQYLQYIYQQQLKMEALALYNASNMRRSNCPAPLFEMTVKKKKEPLLLDLKEQTFWGGGGCVLRTALLLFQ